MTSSFHILLNLVTVTTFFTQLKLVLVGFVKSSDHLFNNFGPVKSSLRTFVVIHVYLLFRSNQLGR